MRTSEAFSLVLHDQYHRTTACQAVTQSVQKPHGLRTFAMGCALAFARAQHEDVVFHDRDHDEPLNESPRLRYTLDDIAANGTFVAVPCAVRKNWWNGALCADVRQACVVERISANVLGLMDMWTGEPISNIAAAPYDIEDVAVAVSEERRLLVTLGHRFTQRNAETFDLTVTRVSKPSQYACVSVLQFPWRRSDGTVVQHSYEQWGPGAWREYWEPWKVCVCTRYVDPCTTFVYCCVGAETAVGLAVVAYELNTITLRLREVWCVDLDVDMWGSGRSCQNTDAPFNFEQAWHRGEVGFATGPRLHVNDDWNVRVSASLHTKDVHTFTTTLDVVLQWDTGRTLRRQLTTFPRDPWGGAALPWQCHPRCPYEGARSQFVSYVPFGHKTDRSWATSVCEDVGNIIHVGVTPPPSWAVVFRNMGIRYVWIEAAVSHAVHAR